MNKDIVQFKLFGFRLSFDDSKPIIVVALNLADAVDIWLKSHDGTEPLEVSFMGVAYGRIDMPF